MSKQFVERIKNKYGDVLIYSRKGKFEASMFKDEYGDEYTLEGYETLSELIQDINSIINKSTRR